MINEARVRGVSPSVGSSLEGAYCGSFDDALRSCFDMQGAGWK